MGHFCGAAFGAMLRSMHVLRLGPILGVSLAAVAAFGCPGDDGETSSTTSSEASLCEQAREDFVACGQTPSSEFVGHCQMWLDFAQGCSAECDTQMEACFRIDGVCRDDYGPDDAQQCSDSVAGQEICLCDHGTTSDPATGTTQGETTGATGSTGATGAAETTGTPTTGG